MKFGTYASTVIRAEVMEIDETLQVDETGLPGEPTLHGEDPAEIVDRGALNELLAMAVNDLPERDRVAIGLHYQDELTLREIGEVLEVTESRVCQIHTQAIVRSRTSVAQAWKPCSANEHARSFARHSKCSQQGFTEPANAPPPSRRGVCLTGDSCVIIPVPGRSTNKAGRTT